MKKLISKILSISLIFTHIVVVCLWDISFAQELEPSVKSFSNLLIYCPKDTTWTVPNPSNTIPTTSFVYDGDGGRVKRIIPNTNKAKNGTLFITYLNNNHYK